MDTQISKWDKDAEHNAELHGTAINIAIPEPADPRKEDHSTKIYKERNDDYPIIGTRIMQMMNQPERAY
jgi:hypothetical protein